MGLQVHIHEAQRILQEAMYVGIDADEEPAKYAMDSIGDDNFVFSTDYPHSDSKYPHATDTFLALPLTEESKHKVLWDNCARLYNLSG